MHSYYECSCGTCVVQIIVLYLKFWYALRLVIYHAFSIDLIYTRMYNYIFFNMCCENYMIKIKVPILTFCLCLIPSLGMFFFAKYNSQGRRFIKIKSGCHLVPFKKHSHNLFHPSIVNASLTGITIILVHTAIPEQHTITVCEYLH